MAVVVDFSVLFYRMLFGGKKNVIENHDYFAHLLMNGLMINFTQFGISKQNPLILAVDCHKKDSWRFEYYTENSKKFKEYQEPVPMEYKGGRVKDDEIPWDKMHEIINDFVVTIDTFSDVQVIKHPKAEADDVIAVVARYFTSLNEPVSIISTDKDFHQLLNKNVRLYNPIKKKEVKVENSRLKLLEHILTGQGKKDNILPIRKGIGPVTAMKMIEEGTLNAEFKLDEELRERFNFNKKLIDLDLLPDNIYNEIEERLKNMTFNFNFKALNDFCTKYRLVNHIENIPKLKLKDNEEGKLF